MNNAALAAGASVFFTLTNSLISPADNIQVTVANPVSGVANYLAYASNIGTGTCAIVLRNMTGGPLSDAVVLNFNILKGATA